MKTLLAALTALLLSACIIVPVPLPVTGAATGPTQVRILPATAPASGQFDQLLNAQRAAASAPALRSHAPLDAVARAHAQDMQSRNYLSHRSPEGLRSDQRVRAAGIATCGTSEVLARGRSTYAATFADWMASPGHKSAMLDPTMYSYGIGRAGNVWAMVLVRPCPV